MKIFLYLLVISFNNFYFQNKFDSKLERNMFNISLINEYKKNKINIKKINNNEEFEGRYLGNFKTNSGKNFFLLVSTYIFDKNSLAKTENHIFIYNDKKQYVGYYYLSQMYDLPIKLENNKLYFKNKDCNEKTIINLNNGIPRAINLKCKNKNNYYEFQI